MQKTIITILSSCLLSSLTLLLTACGVWKIELSPDRELKSTVDAQATLISNLSTQVIDHINRIERQESVISYLATQQMAPFVPTLAPYPTPYQPVSGAVLIEEGRCCIGGVAGDIIEVNVSFESSSPMGQVTEMRVRVGRLRFTENEMTATEWESFLPSKSYKIDVPTNWTGFYVSVQFRDVEGNLSPVYYDDISVEGHPQTPSPQPTP